jgi:hypothetical protein
MGKKFIKSLFVVLSLVVLFSLFSCEKRETLEPEIKGVNPQMTAYTGDVFDFMAGITATDKYGKDVTNKVKYYTAAPMDENGVLIQSGEYSVRYELEINGVVLTQEYAMLKVIFKKPDGPSDNMIFNGDFSSGYTDPFILSQFENGTGTFGVENEELFINITNIAAAQASPRIDYNDLQLDPDKFYEVRFEARANVPRWMHIQIGQLIDQAPWFYSVDPIERFFYLDTTMQSYSFRFQPSTNEGADMSKISLLLEFGKMKEEAILTTCFLDNIVMEEVDSLGEDTTPPTITAPTEHSAYVGEELNVPVTAFDDFDKDITDKLEVSGDEIPVDENGLLTTEGEYTLIYTVKDTAGNEASASVLVKVLPPREFADPDNLFGTPHPEIVYSVSGAGSEDNSKLNPLKWHIWNISDSAWGLGPTTTIVYSFQDDVLTVDIKQNENPNFWANQVFYTTLPFAEGGQFTFTVTVNSNKAGKIVLAGQVVDLVEGDNLVEVPITVSAGAAFTFSVQAGTEADGPVGDIVLKLKDYAITVQEDIEYADPDNLFGTPDDEVAYDAAGAGSEENSKKNPNKWHIWNISDAAWGIGPVTDLVYTYVDGVLTIDIKQNENPNFWANQVFYTTLPFKVGGQFVLTLTINSNKAGTIMVAGEAIDLVEGDNLVEVTITVNDKEAFTLALQAGTADIGPVGDIVLKLSNPAITVKDDVVYADPDNLFGTPSDEVAYDATGIGSEENSKKNPNKWHIWNISDASWGIGPVTTLNYTYVDGVLTIDVKQNENPNFWANQVFYTTLPFEEGGSFVVNIKITSDKAGKISIAGVDVPLVEGENNLEIPITVGAKQAFTFGITFGTANDGPVGDIVLSILEVKIEKDEEGEEPVYADPDNILGTITAESLYLESGIAEEADAKTNPNKFVIWNDLGGWIGTPSTVIYTIDNATLNLTITQPAGSCWFAAQVFYYSLPLENGGTFALTFELNSNKAGKITVNNNVIDIVEGLNEIKVKVTVEALAQFPVSIQFGVESENTNIGDCIVQISALKATPWVEEEPEKLPTPVGLVANNMGDTNLYTAWAHVENAVGYKLYIYNEQNEEVKTLTVTNGQNTPFEELGLPGGTYYAKLQAIGDGVNYLDSDLSAPSANFIVPSNEPGEPKKLATPVGFVAEIIEETNLYTAWAATAGELFKAYIYNTEDTEVKVITVVNGGLIPLTELDLPAGSYYAKLQAIGDGVNTLDSDLSAPSGTFIIS